MRNENNKKGNLKFEELEQSEEFSLGGIGISAMIVTLIAIISSVLVQIF